LTSLLDMSREEKEECVIRLYKENKSTREIAKLVHMSFSGIAAITKKVKLETDRERGQLEEDDDMKSKSKFAQAMKLFSELESPVEVAIALDLPANQVRAIYQEYWELEGMYGLAQIYDDAKYDLDDLLRLHGLTKVLGVEKHDIITAFELIKHNQLQILQWKAAYLRSEINALEWERARSANRLFKVNRMIYESEETLRQKRGETAYLNREYKKLQLRIIDYNTHNLQPMAHSEHDSDSNSTQIVPYNKE
jgi:hypothetical protein